MNQWIKKNEKVFEIGAVAGTSILSYILFSRIATAEQVTQSDLDRKRVIRGVVMHVGDGDNFRMVHVPPFRYFFRRNFKSMQKLFSEQKLSDYTIHIRLAGIDAPECAHFGQPGQPYGPIVKDFLAKQLTGKFVQVEMLRRDQYGRIVGSTSTKRSALLGWFFPRNWSVELLKRGFAVVYEGTGEMYGTKHSKPYLQKLEQTARRNKLGMFASKATSESPREYKKRTKTS